MTSGEHDYWRSSHRANALTNDEPVQIGKSQIEDDEIGMRRINRFHPPLSRRSFDDCGMLLAQRGADGSSDVDFVFDDEQPVILNGHAGHVPTFTIMYGNLHRIKSEGDQ